MAITAMQTTIKNTFIEIDDEAEIDTVIKTKRSSSVPRSWRPTFELTYEKSVSPPSDASTGDSDECLSIGGDNEANLSSSAASDCATSEHTETEQQDDLTSKTDSQCVLCLETLTGSEKGSERGASWAELSDPEWEDFTPKTVLCLSTMVTEETKLRSKLSGKARLFEPISALPPDMLWIMQAAQASLEGDPKISNVHMTEGYYGGATTIVGNYAKGSLKVFELVKTLSLVKIALLDAAAETSNTYIIGYEQQPFYDNAPTGALCTGFSAQIGAVIDSDESTTCWDSFQKGFCPRQSTCRWCHPTDNDLLKIEVVLNEI